LNRDTTIRYICNKTYTYSFQSLGHKNVILEYAEVQTNKELKQKIHSIEMSKSLF
jgi:hypothetical protein